MSLLHATWLFPPEGSGGRLFLWADTWRVATPAVPRLEAPEHPLALNEDDLATWLDDNGLWTEALRPARATLTLPSRSQAAKGRRTHTAGVVALASGGLGPGFGQRGRVAEPAPPGRRAPGDGG
jgi:hypothetical protein